MVTQDQVREALRSVNDPEIGRPIEDIGMLRDIEVLEGGLVRVHVLITIDGCPLKDRITSDVTEALAPVEGVERVEVSLSPMSEEQRASLVSAMLAVACLLRMGPMRSTIFSMLGRSDLVCASSALRMAARWANEVPQQPPTIFAPASTASLT